MRVKNFTHTRNFIKFYEAGLYEFLYFIELRLIDDRIIFK